MYDGVRLMVGFVLNSILIFFLNKIKKMNVK